MGIDAGTSGIRACCINEQGTVLAEASLAFPLPTINGQEISQNPLIWSTSLNQLIDNLRQQISFDSLKAIAIDGTSGTVFFCDADGQPASDALMYNDARSGKQVEQLKRIGANSTVQAVSSGLPKLMWLAENSLEIKAKPKQTFIMHQADWLSYQFTQQLGHSDVNNCLKTGYDPINHKWPDWFEHLPALQGSLPQVHTPGHLISPIAAHVADRLNLPRSVQIIAGTTDSNAAILATGISKPGEAVTSLGSTLVVKIINETPIFDQQYGIYSQPFGDNWLVGGGSNSGGAVLRAFFSDAEMASLSTQINPEQDTGLNYYPLLKRGERFPINDPHLKPHLTPRPDNDVEYFQALLEGIAKIEHSAYAKLAELGAPYPTSIYSAGGGAKNSAWTQIRQRYCQTGVQKSQYTEACYGSALLAKQGYTPDNSQ